MGYIVTMPRARGSLFEDMLGTIKDDGGVSLHRGGTMALAQGSTWFRLGPDHNRGAVVTKERSLLSAGRCQSIKRRYGWAQA